MSPNQPQTSRTAAPPDSVDLPPAGSRNGKHHASGKRDLLALGSTVGTNVLLFIVALLVAAVVWLIYSASPASEKQFIDTKKLQAVFLNTGQVYFGNIQSMNNDYLTLANVFYLQTNSTSGANGQATQNQNVSLVKLGCELHMPYDRMVINAHEVTFWENLQDDGQVAKAVSQYDKQNPSGQKCSDQGQAPNSQSNVQSQNNTGTSAPSTNSSTGTKH